jgi:hypothetical protein
MKEMHSEERQWGRWMREQVVQSKRPVDTLEFQLGWESGRLSQLLAEQQRWMLGEFLELLPLMGKSTEELLIALYGPDLSQESVALSLEPLPEEREPTAPEQKILERHFEESRRVIEEAISRRTSWKRERGEN